MSLPDRERLIALVVKAFRMGYARACEDCALDDVFLIEESEQRDLETLVGCADELEAVLTSEQEHDYFSTACFHQRHAECRKTCKFCLITCRCSCHADPVEKDVRAGERPLPEQEKPTSPERWLLNAAEAIIREHGANSHMWLVRVAENLKLYLADTPPSRASDPQEKLDGHVQEVRCEQVNGAPLSEMRQLEQSGDAVAPADALASALADYIETLDIDLFHSGFRVTIADRCAAFLRSRAAQTETK